MGAYDAMGTNDDAAVTNPALKASGISLLKGILTKLGGAAAALGQAVMASSSPVVIASDQSAVAGSVADGADVTQGAKADASVVDPTASASVVALLKGDKTLAGALTEAAPATDTASSGLNGRLQRIAQRITSLIALLPAALDGSGFFKVHEQGTATVSGTVTTTPPANASANITQVGGSALAEGQAAMANSIPVAIASNQSAVPVSGTFWQATQPVSGTVTANAGTGTMAGSVADGADVTQGAKADAAQTDQTQTASAIAFLKGIIGTLKTLVVLAAGENHIGAVGGHTLRVTSTFTRPADTVAYVSGDLVANNTVANSVVSLTGTLSRATGKGGMIRRVKVKKSGTVLTNAQFRVHFYTTSPTQTGGAGAGTGDNAAWSTDQAGTYAGSCDVTIDKGFTDGAAGYGVPLIGSEINFTADTFYWLLEARAAYTPISTEVFVVDVEILPN